MSFPLDDKQLDKLFDNNAADFESALKKAAQDLYKRRETAFTPEIMRRVEADIYLQVLDNLWMQHLENMDHLREGIHWISVGQRDPLVEYRSRGQLLFDEMQLQLRHDIVRALMHAQPVDLAAAPVETELTLAARGSVDNASQINQGGEEFDASDFSGKSAKQATQPKSKQQGQRKKARKTERKRKTAARKRK